MRTNSRKVVEELRDLIERTIKKDLQQGRSKRRGEAYFAPYGEPLSDARTKLETFFIVR